MCQKKCTACLIICRSHNQECQQQNFGTRASCRSFLMQSEKTWKLLEKNLTVQIVG